MIEVFTHINSKMYVPETLQRMIQGARLFLSWSSLFFDTKPGEGKKNYKLLHVKSFYTQSWKQHRLIVYWPDFSHMKISNCKQAGKYSSAVFPERRENWFDEEPASIYHMIILFQSIIHPTVRMSIIKMQIHTRNSLNLESLLSFHCLPHNV